MVHSGPDPWTGAETVDLTLSSPSPSPDPQPQPQPQPSWRPSLALPLSQPPPRPEPSVFYRPPPPPQRTAPFVEPPPARIHPDHLRHIIYSSDPASVSSVLYHLCMTSPALSGAVVRGLAPHSAWAKATVSDYQRKVGSLHHEKPPSSLPVPKLEPGVRPAQGSASQPLMHPIVKSEVHHMHSKPSLSGTAPHPFPHPVVKEEVRPMHSNGGMTLPQPSGRPPGPSAFTIPQRPYPPSPTDNLRNPPNLNPSSTSHGPQLPRGPSPIHTPPPKKTEEEDQWWSDSDDASWHSLS